MFINKFCFILLGVLLMAVHSTSCFSAGIDDTTTIAKRPQSCPPPTQIFKCDFQNCGLQSPYFTEYLPNVAPGTRGYIAIVPVLSPSPAPPSSVPEYQRLAVAGSCLSPRYYHTNGLLIDTKASNSSGGAGGSSGDVAWGFRGALSPGHYELVFWLKGNSSFSNNIVDAFARNSATNAVVPARLIHPTTKATVSPASIVDDTGCGNLITFAFEIYSSGYNEVCIAPRVPLIQTEPCDFIIDAAELNNLGSPPAPAINVPSCGSNEITVTVSNPVPGPCNYRWSLMYANGAQNVLQGCGPSFTVQKNLDPTTYSVEDMSVAGCPSAKATFVIPGISGPPVVPDISRCGQGLVTLRVTNPQFEYEWFEVTSSGQFLLAPNQSSPDNSSIQVHVSENTTFRVRTKGSSTCLPGPERTVQVTVFRVLPSLTLNTALSGSSPYHRGTALQFTGSVAGTGTNTTYQWNWGDQSITGPSSNNTAVHTYARAGIYNIALTASQRFSTSLNCSEVTMYSITIKEPLCDIVVPLSSTGGAPTGFAQDVVSGAIKYTYGTNLSCVPATMLECLGGQPSIVPNVVSATATAFADTLVHDEADYRVGGYANNPFLAGKRRLRPYASYTYNTPLNVTTNNLSYETGTFALAGFNWHSSARARPAKWLAAAIAERLSPDGEVLQERDPLNIRSVAKFGYGKATVATVNVPQVGTPPATDNASNHSLPYLQAHNADYATVLFESFENLYESSALWFGEDRFALDRSEVSFLSSNVNEGTDWRHTGKRAAQLTFANNQSRLTLPTIQMTPQVLQNGFLFKVWVHHTLSAPGGRVALVDKVEDYEEYGAGNLTMIAKTGDWELWATHVPVTSGIVSGYPLTPQLTFTGTPTNSIAPVVWVDDVRLQPGDAQMTTYVYDSKNFRLLASFDDQHFGLLYQYNDEGKLIRKQVETERGIKTIQETQYHTPIIRP